MIKFELVTLDGAKFGEEVFEVILPTNDGYIAIFPEHMPLVSIAVPGVISVRRKRSDPDTKLEYFATNGGIIEVGDNKVRVLVDEADREDEINEQEAQKAFDHARELAKQAKDNLSLQQAQTLVDRQAVRLQVANLRRQKRH
jgi:F-type H+-transporting ATPase subunit epsilon